MVDRISCRILQMELPFRHTCQVYRINPRAEEIMKTHLESGEQRITLVNPAGWKLLGYAVPFLSMEEQYQNGKNFLGGLTLTQAQKEQYHCD